MVKLINNQKKRSFFDRLRLIISRSGKDTTVAYQEGEYPYFTDEMITPVEKPLSTRDAVYIYRTYMLAIGYLEKSEMSDFVNSLKDGMDEHEQFLKEEVKAARETVVEAKAEARPEIKRIKKLRSKSKDADEKADYSADLEEVEFEVVSSQRDLAAAVEELTQFKKDKRQFLINYINSELHGSNWNQGRDG